MEMNLKKATEKVAEEVTDVNEAKPSTTLAVQEPANEVGTQIAVASEGIQDSEGFFTSDDVKPPRINLLQGMSDRELVKKFGVGSFVFNKDILLAPDDGSFLLVPLRMKKQFQQNLPYDTDEIQQVFDHPEQVREVGGHFKYDRDNPDDPDRYDPILHLQCMVGKPEDCPKELEALFAYGVGDNDWGMALWTLSGSSYNSAGQTLIEHRATLLRKGLCTGRYTVTSEERSNAKNTWNRANIRFSGHNSQEEIALFSALINNA